MLNLRKRPVVETGNDTPIVDATANLIAGAVRAIEGRLADGEDCEAVRHRLRQLQDTSATGDFRALALAAAETVVAMLEHMSVLGKALSDAEGRASRFQRMLDGMPVNIITCDPTDFKIDYVNHATVATLRGIEHLLPVKADHLVGQSIDIFHAHPEHQRRILRDPRKLPHHARIRLGEETLDLTVSGIEGAGGAHAGMMLTWSVVTEKVKTDAENLLLRQMVENMPINVMACDPKTFQITYANKATLATLRRIENLLPVKVDELVGQSVDIFHKNPEHQRRLLGNPRNLPHRAKIRVGPETLDLRVEAITDTAGNYLSAMLSWAIVTQQVTLADTFETRVKAVAQAVSSAATEMQTTAQSLAAAAEQTTRQSQTVASAAQQTALNTQSVASASEELTASVTEISRQVAESTRVAAEAAAHAEQTNEIVDSLAEAAKQIDSIVSLIKDIAGQTNLLALNATIEAARAGEAGKGFAVVAGEVKSLAKQTATATEDIARRVGEIQSKTHSAVDAIGAIAKVIGRISEISGSIAAAVEEQSASTNEISSNVQIVAGSTREVSSNIVGVTQAAGETGQSSSALLGAAGELAQQSEMLSTEVDRFLEEMRKL